MNIDPLKYGYRQSVQKGNQLIAVIFKPFWIPFRRYNKGRLISIYSTAMLPELSPLSHHRQSFQASVRSAAKTDQRFIVELSRQISSDILKQAFNLSPKLIAFCREWCPLRLIIRQCSPVYLSKGRCQQLPNDSRATEVDQLYAAQPQHRCVIESLSFMRCSKCSNCFQLV